MQDIGGQVNTAERILPDKLQSLAYSITRLVQIRHRIADISGRCGIPIPISPDTKSPSPNPTDHISLLELHLLSMNVVLEDIDNQLTELERII